MLIVFTLIVQFILAWMMGFSFGIIGMWYSYVMTRPHMLLSGLYRKLYVHAQAGAEERDPMEVWWFKLAIGCEKCIAGQMALWTFPFIIGISEYSWYTAIFHLLSIAIAIGAAEIIKSKYISWVN